MGAGQQSVESIPEGLGDMVCTHLCHIDLSRDFEGVSEKCVRTYIRTYYDRFGVLRLSQDTDSDVMFGFLFSPIPNTFHMHNVVLCHI